MLKVIFSSPIPYNSIHLFTRRGKVKNIIIYPICLFVGKYKNKKLVFFLSRRRRRVNVQLLQNRVYIRILCV